MEATHDTMSVLRARAHETRFDSLTSLRDAAKDEVRKVVVGQDHAVELLLVAALAHGHVLIEGPPGSAKTLLGRAMGRALAHELGHYLLASKVHTPRGLMQTPRSASEMFSPTRVRFEIDPVQKQAVVSRLTRTTILSDARAGVAGPR